MRQHIKSGAGVAIRSVARGSPFYHGGLRGGDRILAINGENIVSELDFHFFAADERLFITGLRNEQPFELEVERTEGAFTGVILMEQPMQRCSNHCIFCFIDQMPPGLRHSLYIKDEDVRLSLFNGNYITLSTFQKRDLEQIVRIGLSPLFISVHATDTALRRRMLRNRKAPDIMQQLSFLAAHGIRFHTQIVVCPSYNDGEMLERSVGELLMLGESLRSIAVVPVGLTRFRTQELPAVDRQVAVTVCRTMDRMSDRAAKKDGFRKVFLADEFFIKAQLPIPGRKYYEDYPQIENGVGLVRQLLDSWQSVKKRLHPRKVKYRGNYQGGRLIITSVSARSFIRMIIDEFHMMCPDVRFDIIAVTNHFFGETVSVAGLLTAADIIRQVKDLLKHSSYKELIVPAVLFNFAGYTLDGFSPARIGKAVGLPVRIVTSLEELLAP